MNAIGIISGNSERTK